MKHYHPILLLLVNIYYIIIKIDTFFYLQIIIFVGGDKDVISKQESSKSKSDLSVSIFEQLTLPLRDGRTTVSEAGSSGQVNLSEVVNSNDPSTEIHVSFISNIEVLYYLICCFAEIISSYKYRKLASIASWRYIG